MAVVAKRSVMTLYSDPLCPYCHQVRIVLAEKGVAVDVLEVTKGEIPEDLKEINPYISVPTLVDRDLVLYDSQIIMEYLDERFPHPPLMPVYPVARAKSRLLMHRIQKDWYSLVENIIKSTPNKAEKARKSLQDSLLAVNVVFSQLPYFMSDDFSLVDCALAPLLYRLEVYGIDLGDKAEDLMAYRERLFSREPFQASLTELERELIEEDVVA